MCRNGSACIGESRGPLNRVMDVKRDIWELVGVISFGSRFCGKKKPFVSTRISLEIGRWIRRVVGDELPSYL